MSLAWVCGFITYFFKPKFLYPQVGNFGNKESDFGLFGNLSVGYNYNLHDILNLICDLELKSLEKCTCFIFDYTHKYIKDTNMQIQVIGANPDVHNVEESIRSALTSWWEEQSSRLSTFYETNDIFAIRKEFLVSLKEALIPVGILDSYQVAGIFVNWGDKYRVPMREIEYERDEAKKRLVTYFRELGHNG